MILEVWRFKDLCCSQMFYCRKVNLKKTEEKYNLVVTSNSTLSLGPGYPDDSDDRKVAFQAIRQAFRNL